MSIVQPPTPNFDRPQFFNEPNWADRIGATLGSVLEIMAKAEQAKQQRTEFESKQRYYDTQTQGNVLDNEKKVADAKLERAKQRAAVVGENHYKTWVKAGAKYENLGDFTAKINDPLASQDFLNRAFTHQQAVSQGALARGNVIDTDVKGATRDDVVSGAHTQAQRSASEAARAASEGRVQAATEQTQITDAKTLAALHEEQRKRAAAEAAQPILPDASQQNAAMNEWKATGAAIGPIYKKYGLTLPQGVDPNQKFVVQTKAMAIRRAEQKSAAAFVTAANAQIEELERAGVTISKFTPVKKAVPFDLARSMIPEQEQALLQANEQLIAQYNLSISGKASTDNEFTRNYGTLAPLAGDKPQVREQKRIMRETMVQVIYDASQGEGRPIAEIFQSVIGAARAKGASPVVIKTLQQSMMDAKRMEQQAQADHSAEAAPLVASPDATGADSISAVLQGYGR